MTEYPIFEVTAAELDEVARLHRAAFPRSALSRLGDGAVRRYYEWLLLGPHDTVSMGVRRDGRLVCFCNAGVYRGVMHGYLHKNRAYLAGRVLSRPWLVFNPVFVERLRAGLRALWRRYSGRAQPAQPGDGGKAGERFGMLVLATDPGYERQGIASLMVKKCEAIARERGFAELGLTVHPDNSKAARFYAARGWERVVENGTWTGRMIKRVGPLET